MRRRREGLNTAMGKHLHTSFKRRSKGEKSRSVFRYTLGERRRNGGMVIPDGGKVTTRSNVRKT